MVDEWRAGRWETKTSDVRIQNTEYRIQNEKNPREATIGFPRSFLNSEFCILYSDI
jgi:hypothetical protein